MHSSAHPRPHPMAPTNRTRTNSPPPPPPKTPPRYAPLCSSPSLKVVERDSETEGREGGRARESAYARAIRRERRQEERSRGREKRLSCTSRSSCDTSLSIKPSSRALLPQLGQGKPRGNPTSAHAATQTIEERFPLPDSKCLSTLSCPCSVCVYVCVLCVCCVCVVCVCVVV
jgi:hypothetical protein